MFSLVDCCRGVAIFVSELFLESAEKHLVRFFEIENFWIRVQIMSVVNVDGEMDTMGFTWGSIGRQLFVVEKVRISGLDYEMEVDFICQAARLRTAYLGHP